MTSRRGRKEVFVWLWLPGETAPVVAGRLVGGRGRLHFNYGDSYLARIGGEPAAIPIHTPELPLRAGELPLPKGLDMPGSIRDAAPDAWGRRVIIHKLMGHRRDEIDVDKLDEATYLLESGSDRTGALDFQASPTEYVPREAENADMRELLESAERVEQDLALTPELDQALIHGSSIGGARPKALIQDGNRKCIAKFSLESDMYSVIKAEFIAMRLAQLAGLEVAQVELRRVAGKDVLLIERFDREPKDAGWARKAMISALTLLELHEMQARYASYETLAEVIRHRFAKPKKTLQELFARLAFNILCGNTDDHARNHAAFWDGRELRLTPAYDICPQARTGGEASQGMRICGNNNLSRLKTCLDTAHNFLLSEADACAIFDRLTTTIRKHWDEVCEQAKLSEDRKKFFWRRQFLNPYSMAVT